MPLTFHSLDTVADTNAALSAGRMRYFGGGTLVVRAANEGDLSFDGLIRSTDPQLAKIEVKEGVALLGASVTMSVIARDGRLAALAPAARAVGGPAIRNMATVGGNLFAPAPYGDFAVALLALGATVMFDNTSLDIDAFLAVREEVDEIVTQVAVPLPAEGTFRFLKVSRIKPKGVSVLSIAAVLGSDASGHITSARIALACMADRPTRAKAAEAVLVGATLSKDGVAAAVEAVTDGIRPITDPIASEWYRREVLPVHFRRLLLR